MNLLTLSVSYLRAKPLNTLLNVLLLALGVATIVVLLLFSHQLQERLTRDAQGIDLVVGAKGSPLQLILSSIYHLDIPTGNIPLAEADKLRANRLVKSAIPLAMGDSYRGYRIVGASSDYLSLYQARFSQGRAWQQPLEAVLGADVARASGLVLGARFAGSHGLVDGGEEHGDAPYTVVGILARSGSVLDRLVLTGVESVWAVHSHAEEHEAGEAEHGDEPAHTDHDEHDEHPDEHDHAAESASADSAPKEITALLIQYRSPLAAALLPRQINSQTALQAASPAFETARLFNIVGVGMNAVRAFAGILIFSAMLSIFIALYHALTERRHDMAILRTLGAARAQLVYALLLEGIILTLLGTALGLLLGHLVTELAGQWLTQAQQFNITGWTWLYQEYWLILLALIVGALAALLPAILAYRTDIATTLAQG